MHKVADGSKSVTPLYPKCAISQTTDSQRSFRKELQYKAKQDLVILPQQIWLFSAPLGFLLKFSSATLRWYATPAAWTSKLEYVFLNRLAERLAFVNFFAEKPKARYVCLKSRLPSPCTKSSTPMLQSRWIKNDIFQTYYLPNRQSLQKILRNSQ